MKSFIFCMALALLLHALPVGAQDFTLNVLVVDKDPNGTNVRSAPSGETIHVIPFAGKGAMRLVSVSSAKKGWFKVDADGVEGWMHGSVLGICAGATEDGDPSLNKAPNDQNPPLMRIPADSPVGLLDIKDRWLKVRYVDAKGARHEGWLPEQVITLSEGELETCAAAWGYLK